jgi:hypothetical protein
VSSFGLGLSSLASLALVPSRALSHIHFSIMDLALSTIMFNMLHYDLSLIVWKPYYIWALKGHGSILDMFDFHSYWNAPLVSYFLAHILRHEHILLLA